MAAGRALASNSAVIAVARASAGVGRAAAMVIAARLVATGDFGQLALAFALVEIFRQLADFGLEIVATRRIARSTPAEVGGAAGTALALKTGLGVAAYGVLLLVAGLLYRHTGVFPVAAIVGPMVIGWSASTAVAAYFQARLAMVRVAWTTVAGTLATLVLVVALVLSGRASLHAVAACFVIGDLGAGLLAFCVLSREPEVQLHVRRQTAVDLLHTAWPVAFTQLLVIAYFRLDVIMLAWLGRVEAVGLYGVAFKITEPLLLVPAAIAASFYAASAPLWGRAGGETALGLYRRLAVVAALYGLVVAILLMVGAPSLLEALVPRYVQAAPALAVLSWSLVFMSANMVTTAALNSLGAYRLTTVIAATTLVTSFVANAALIPRFGIVGASAATVVTEAMNCALQLFGLAAVLHRRVPAPVI